ncbi:MAG: serine O-acetyltransferase [Chloroflexi bacterium]|nr:serine O-acetyltransferase [Chloroflexota bacterium]
MFPWRLLVSIRRDIQAIFERDPAAVNILEVLLAYPGFHALLLHRVAHWLHQRGAPVLPRLVSHLNRALTGIEIHPGAKIGPGCFIDHGMGVVIGETAEVGEDCTLYQGVTLGGIGRERGKRHPSVGKGVVIGVGATVLGAITIGDYARIGGGSVVLQSVPAGATAVGVPAKVVAAPKLGPNGEQRVERLPDPNAEMISTLQYQVAELESRIAALEEQLEKARNQLSQAARGQRG